MKLINIVFFVVSINVMIFLTTSLGIWSSDIVPGGLNPENMINIFLGGYAGIAGLLVIVGAAVLASIFFNQEKIAGYTLLGVIYLATSNMAVVQISAIEAYVGDFPISAVYIGILGLVFLSFIIQAIFGGGKQYE